MKHHIRRRGHKRTKGLWVDRIAGRGRNISKQFNHQISISQPLYPFLSKKIHCSDLESGFLTARLELSHDLKQVRFVRSPLRIRNLLPLQISSCDTEYLNVTDQVIDSNNRNFGLDGLHTIFGWWIKGCRNRQSWFERIWWNRQPCLVGDHIS